MPDPFVIEFYQSRVVDIGSDNQTADLMFVCYGTDDDAVARALFASEIPALFLGIYIDTIHIEPVGGLFWKADVHYDSKITNTEEGLGDASNPNTPPANPGDSDPLGAEWSFDISVVDEKITQSKATISKTKRGPGVAPDNQKAIGISNDGEVEGCNRSSPHMEFSLTRVFGFVTLAYLRSLYTLVGTTNNASFYGYPTGTVLFIGASAKSQDNQKITISFKFAARPNETNIAICDNLTVPAKKGWEYLWVSYKNTQDNNRLFMQPDAAYVEKIYDSSNFSLIGIGG